MNIDLLKFETEMRNWLLDIFQEDGDEEEIEELSYTQLVRAVNRYFDGGIDGVI